MNNTYIIIDWPEIQNYMDKPGFEENSFLINDAKGLEKFGSSAYFVNKEWVENNPSTLEFNLNLNIQTNSNSTNIWLSDDIGGSGIKVIAESYETAINKLIGYLLSYEDIIKKL